MTPSPHLSLSRFLSHFLPGSVPTALTFHLRACNHTIPEPDILPDFLPQQPYLILLICQGQLSRPTHLRCHYCKRDCKTVATLSQKYLDPIHIHVTLPLIPLWYPHHVLCELQQDGKHLTLLWSSLGLLSRPYGRCWLFLNRKADILDSFLLGPCHIGCNRTVGRFQFKHI